MVGGGNAEMARLLLVDDSPSVLEVFGRMLGHLGHVVVEASSGDEALNAYRAERPDGVFLDLTMPAWAGSMCCASCARSTPTPASPC